MHDSKFTMQYEQPEQPSSRQWSIVIGQWSMVSPTLIFGYEIFFYLLNALKYKMNFRILLILFLIINYFHAECQVTFQVKNLQFQSPQTMKQTSDHGYVIGGQILDTISLNDDISALLKLDSLGNEQWEVLYPLWSGHDSYVTSVFQASDGNYVYSGYDDMVANASIIMYKTNPSGFNIWTHSFGVSQTRLPSFTQETADHNYILCGTQTVGIWRSVSLIKTTPTGYIIWERNYSDPNIPMGTCTGMEQTSDSGFIIIGTSYYMGSFLIKTDSLGSPQWYKQYGDSLDMFTGNYTSGSCLKQMPDGGFICAGSNRQFSGGAFIFKTDMNGDTIWTRRISGPEGHSIEAIEETSDSNFVITGAIGDANTFSEQLFLAKMDQTGDTLWTKIFGDGSAFNKSGTAIVVTSDGGLAVLGTTSNIGTQLIKTDAIGNSSCNLLYKATTLESHSFNIVTSTINVDTTMNQGFQGMPAYMYPMRTVTSCISLGVKETLEPTTDFTISPNPANVKISINSTTAFVRSTIYNVYGTAIHSGKNESEINISSLPDGIYFIQVQTDKGVVNRKFIKE